MIEVMRSSESDVPSFANRIPLENKIGVITKADCGIPYSHDGKTCYLAAGIRVVAP